MKRLFLFIIISVLLSCNNKSKPPGYSPEDPWPIKEEVVRLAVHTLTDSGKILEASPSMVIKDVITDSVTKKDKIIIDTLWWITRMLPKKDAAGKDMLDSLGKVITEKRYFARPRDSVRWKIQGVPYDSLMSKYAPTH